MTYFDGTDDNFYSYDVTSRIEELELRELEIEGLDAEEEEELAALKGLRNEAESMEDWKYGLGFISDDSFEDFAQELAEDIGAFDLNAGWPAMHIDWEAAAESLKMDYTSFEFRGTTYWAR